MNFTEIDSKKEKLDIKIDKDAIVLARIFIKKPVVTVNADFLKLSEMEKDLVITHLVIYQSIGGGDEILKADNFTVEYFDKKGMKISDIKKIFTKIIQIATSKAPYSIKIAKDRIENLSLY